MARKVKGYIVRLKPAHKKSPYKTAWNIELEHGIKYQTSNRYIEYEGDEGVFVKNLSHKVAQLAEIYGVDVWDYVEIVYEDGDVEEGQKKTPTPAVA